MANLTSYIPAMISGAVLAIAGYHISLYLMKQRSQQFLAFCALSLSTGLFVLSAAGIYVSSATSTVIFWQQTNTIGQVLSLLSFFWFIHAATEILPKSLYRALGLVMVAFIFLLIINPMDLFWEKDNITPKIIFGLFQPGILMQGANHGPWMDAIAPISFSIAGFIIYAIAAYAKKTSLKEAATLIIAFGLILTAGILDALKFAGVLNILPYLQEYGYALAVMFLASGFSFEVIEEAVDSERLEELAQDLEERIEDTTIESHRQQQYFRSLFEYNPLAIVTLDKASNIAAANQAFCDLFGYTSEELIGKNLDSIIAPTDKKSDLIAITDDVQKGDQIRITTQRMRKDGSMIPVELHGVPIIVNGETHGALAIYRDISERLQAEAELRQQKYLEQKYFDAAGVILLAINQRAEVIKVAV